ncbi:MAG TPA: hypothetical protein ENH82_10970 [bacterium]|nr:hypothetical protein [bacterium]
MSLRSRPVRLSEEVNDRLFYTTDSIIDKFTLKRYQYELESLHNKGKMELDDFVALGEVYFHEKRYDQFLSIVEEGLRKHKDLYLLGNYIMGKMMIHDQNLYSLRSFNLYKEWFNNQYNPDNKPLSFQFSHDFWPFLGKKYRFAKELLGNITIGYDRICRIEVGPLVIAEAYDHFEQERCDFFNHAFEIFIERLLLETISSEEEEYFKDILGAANYKEIAEKASLAAAKKKYKMTEIPGIDRKLRKELLVIVTSEKGYTYASNPDLEIYESGDTPDEAMSEFYDFFRVDLENWINTPLDSLTPEAKSLKAKYMEYIES